MKDKKIFKKAMVDSAKAIIDTYEKDVKKDEKRDIENLNWAMEHLNDEDAKKKRK